MRHSLFIAVKNLLKYMFAFLLSGFPIPCLSSSEMNAREAKIECSLFSPDIYLVKSSLNVLWNKTFP